MPSEPAGRLFQKTPYRRNFMRLYGVGFALQTAYASRSSLVFQSVHDYSGLNLNQYGVASPCRTICTVCGFVALS
ncbi:citrate (Si)-synthase [Neisseria meningitidis]|uniref:citrate (Si)-synthase n=1 Tax=Neisseria meningitidis TaxID=487 RepID=UPI003A7FDDDA